MQYDFLYERSAHPFGKSWEKWAALWCNWMFSIPKKKNPSLDETGKYCSINQNDENVWFLTGTFGNIIVPVKRKCTIPARKAIFFPILVKEDSLEEDSDLKTELELIKRSRDATNRLIQMEAAIDGEIVDQLESYRAQSEVFDLVFPKDNVYDVKPGLTRSVCDGYWLFIKPLEIGKHDIYFKGETLLKEAHTLTHLKGREVYHPIMRHINEKSTFKLEVSYELTIISEDRV
jgi:hypothetical protein